LLRQKDGSCGAFLLGTVIAMCSICPDVGSASTPNRAEKAGQLNRKQDRLFEISVAVKDGGFPLGQTIALVDRGGRLHKAERQSFLATVKKALRAEFFERLSQTLPDSKHVTLGEIGQAGLEATYSETGLEIQISPTVEQRPRGEIKGRVRTAGNSGNTTAPASLSGYVNTHVGIGYEEGDKAGSGRFEIPSMFLDGAVRLEELVLEGAAQVNTSGELIQHSLRLVHDNPEFALRATGGEVQISPDGILAAPALMGVALERNFSLLQPSSNIRPTGKRSFRVERRSDVRVIVNGHEVRRLQLPPGEYDLDDLPLASGGNDIQVIIKDEFGNTESVDFSILFNRALLRPGLSEWSLAAGKPTQSNASRKQDKLADPGPVIVGSVRTGVSETLTTGAALHRSGEETLGGLSALFQNELGLLGISTRASSNDVGQFGWSGEVELNFDKAVLWSDRASFNLGLEYFSEHAIASLADEHPQGSRFRVQGSLYQPIWMDINLSLSGYYLFSPDDDERRYGLSVSANKSLSEDTSIGLSGSFDRDNGINNDLTPDDGFSLFARLRYQPSNASSMSLMYDAVSQTSAASYDTHFEKGSNRIALGADVEHHPDTSNGSSENVVGADFSVSNSRYELNASHSRHLEGLGDRQFSSRTAVNAGWGTAFADGAFAFGRPVRNAFAIVDAHDNLDDSHIRIAPSKETHRAQIDLFGPALIPDISAYGQASLPYDIEDAPAGYNFGTGSFSLHPSYKSGYLLTVGTDFSLSAAGILNSADGKPLELKSGTITSSQYPDQSIVIFTNRSGRFSVQGLKAGDWVITMNDGDQSQYALTITEDASGFIQLGALVPESGEQ
jgi:outer membrane usher protein